MKKRFLLSAVSCVIAGFTHSVAANEFEVRGNIELQNRYFIEDPLFPTQENNYLSLAAAPEFFWSWNDGNDSFEFIPSARVDQHDDERTHMDIREMAWIHVGDDWESRVGVRRVFWGVTEFQHLVDIINKSDSVEDVDNEDKLGQPMVNFSLVRDWGIVDFFVMPYFRERTFAGPEGRPGIPLVNADEAFYESSDEEEHIDLAVRWSHSIGDYEVALSLFDGTSREPILLGNITNTDPFEYELVPYYQQITQFGFELQGNVEDMLWKLEMIHNDNAIEDYWALQGGFEYSMYGIMESNADLGFLMEYGWDGRGEDGGSNFQNDLFFGTRLAMNDVDSTELLAGLSYDLDFESTSFLVEASKRFGENVKASLDIRLFSADEPEDPVYLFRDDDHIQLTVQYYY